MKHPSIAIAIAMFALAASAVPDVPAAAAPTGRAATLIAMPPAAEAPALDRAQVEQILHDYLFEHPEIIPQAMQLLEERERNKTVAQLRSQLETPFEGAFIGNPDADVVVVEFFDYACTHCRRSMADIDRLVADDANVKVVFREFPILSKESVDAARMSLQAARGGSYAQYHHDVFAAGHVDKKVIKAAAAPGRVTLPEDLTLLDAELSANHRMAREIGITGTPAFIVGGQFVSGAVGYDRLKELVASARAISSTQK